MTNIERRALYNLLRMHWLDHPNLPIEPWQIKDYKALSLADLFAGLSCLSIQLDKTSFIAYAEECDSPEELTEHLIGDQSVKAEIEDQTYLLVFELWRRLMSEKQTLSVFCDALDYLIFLYDANQLIHPVDLQDALTHLLVILNENVDAGIEPKEAFRTISAYCANDLETFLYDFISEQIETEDESYAQELLDGFSPYFENNKWFTLLRLRILNQLNTKSAHRLLSQLIEDHLEDKDLEFNFELLAFMSEAGTPQLLRDLLNETIPLLKSEEDFQDLLTICIDYYQRLDQEKPEHLLQNILNKRANQNLKNSFNTKDPDLNALLTIAFSEK